MRSKSAPGENAGSAGRLTARSGETRNARGRAIWFDPRFALGLVLVVLSVAGVAGIVTAAGASVDVLSARADLSPGQLVTRSDLVATSVRAGGESRYYLTARDVPGRGVVVTRPVSAGELVPRSALGRADGIDLSSVVVSVTTALPTPVVPGARVDLWSAARSGLSGTNGEDPPPTGGAAYDAPAVLVPGAVVVRVTQDKQFVGSGATTSVELLVARDSTADVLDAIANGAALSIVPVDLPLGR